MPATATAAAASASFCNVAADSPMRASWETWLDIRDGLLRPTQVAPEASILLMPTACGARGADACCKFVSAYLYPSMAPTYSTTSTADLKKQPHHHPCFQRRRVLSTSISAAPPMVPRYPSPSDKTNVNQNNHHDHHPQSNADRQFEKQPDEYLDIVTVMEESLWDIEARNDNENALLWLIPGARLSMPHSTRRASTTFVFISTFEQAQGRLLSLRVHWDQGSVLRQLGLIEPILKSDCNYVFDDRYTLPCLRCDPEVVLNAQNDPAFAAFQQTGCDDTAAPTHGFKKTKCHADNSILGQRSQSPASPPSSSSSSAPNMRLNAFPTAINSAREAIRARLAAAGRPPSSALKPLGCCQISASSNVENSAANICLQALSKTPKELVQHTDAPPPAHVDVKPRRSKDARIRPDLDSHVFGTSSRENEDQNAFFQTPGGGSCDQPRLTNNDPHASSSPALPRQMGMRQRFSNSEATQSAGFKSHPSNQQQQMQPPPPWGLENQSPCNGAVVRTRASMQSSIILGGDVRVMDDYSSSNQNCQPKQSDAAHENAPSAYVRRQHLGTQMASVTDKEYQKSNYMGRQSGGGKTTIQLG